MPKLKTSPMTIVLRALGTLVLAVGFVFLVGRVPFVPDRSSDSELGSALTPYSGARPSELMLNAGSLETDDPIGTSNSSVPVTAGLNPSMSLFNANFAGAGANAGFSTAEHLVPGPCLGAGTRYLAETCPDCQVFAEENESDVRSMLMWTEKIDGVDVIQTVSKDCIASSPGGTPIVGTLTFGGGTADLTAESSNAALNRVPLLPGAIRIGAIEMGAWLATFDEVARPSTAISEMASALLKRGWRAASDGEVKDTAFQGELVFVNNSDAFCVISLSKQGDKYQLVTVVSS